ncbi:MAG: site-specific integrase [Thermaceae bacterium]|nr:site-specific integrase [Thermaceae bacterium]
MRKRVSARTEDDCLTRAKELQIQYARGLLNEPSSLTFEEFAEQWLTRQGRSVKPATIEAYRRELKYAFAYIGKKRLTELKPAHVRAMLEGLS